MKSVHPAGRGRRCYDKLISDTEIKQGSAALLWCALRCGGPLPDGFAFKAWGANVKQDTWKKITHTNTCICVCVPKQSLQATAPQHSACVCVFVHTSTSHLWSPFLPWKIPLVITTHRMAPFLHNYANVISWHKRCAFPNVFAALSTSQN